MSYHRILPIPEALARSTSTRSRDDGADSLLQNSIMISEKRKSSFAQRVRSPTSSQRSSSPFVDRRQETLSVSSGEEIGESSELHEGTSSQVSNTEFRRLPSVSKAWQAESPSDICLCQPDPKVPRPRNAFILYRQHYQAAVVAQNPGLANPEISKVIGEQWRDSPPEVKKHWKSLADEEKLRHQKQHPNYRYQPRRSGRSNSLTSNQPGAAPNESSRCAKCGRQIITTPTSIPSLSTTAEDRPPATPYTPTVASGSTGGRYIRTLGSPRLNDLQSAAYRQPIQQPHSADIGALPSPRFKRPSISGGPQSPTDLKRRRIGHQGNYTSVRHPNGPGTPFPYRRDSQGPPNGLSHSYHGKPSSNVGFAMAPPPRPHTYADPSLTLPPIQTHLASLRDHDTGGSSQAKSLQAMVMSISPLNKIRVLAKISPPLAVPGPLSPKFATRGIAIAIDGQDEAAIKTITGYLSKELGHSNTVRVFELEDEEGQTRKSTSSQQSKTSGQGDGIFEARTYDGYLSLTQRYHALSASVISFLTTPLISATTTSPQPLDPGEDSEDPVSPKTIPKPKTRSSASKEAADEGKNTEPKGIPIALLPRYALTHADRYACSLPITDAYAPIDHWQWMATLWRGIVGADITIAVRPSAVPAETPTTAELMAGKASGGATPGTAGSMKANLGSALRREVGGNGGSAVGQAVDVRLEDARAIVLRAGEKGGVPEGNLRRVGFEVGEWIRGKVERRRES